MTCSKFLILLECQCRIRNDLQNFFYVFSLTLFDKKQISFSAKSGPGAGTMYQFKTKVTLKFNGENTW